MEHLLITGGNGQLGRCLSRTLKDDYALTILTRAEFDLAHPEDFLGTYLNARPYKAVINTAAYTAVDQAEKEPETAQLINSTAVGEIAQACAHVDVPLIHISTDYVYDNGLKRPLREDDPVNPRSIYAKTKLAGEKAALSANPQSYIIRTSWVFSEYGKNFVRTMLSLASRGIAPKVVNDQAGCPTYAGDLSEAIAAVLSRTGRSLPGIYNFCNSGATNWYEFARKIYETAGLDIDVSPITTVEFGAPAPRPGYSVLDTSRFRQTFGINPRPWTEALADCIARLSDNPSGDN